MATKGLLGEQGRWLKPVEAQCPAPVPPGVLGRGGSAAMLGGGDGDPRLLPTSGPHPESLTSVPFDLRACARLDCGQAGAVGGWAQVKK